VTGSDFRKQKINPPRWQVEVEESSILFSRPFFGGRFLKDI
jgi:hypothetical protein